MTKAEAKINQNISMLAKDHSPTIGASLSQSKARKFQIVGTKPHIPDLNAEPCLNSEGEEKGEIEKKYFAPPLYYELQVEIFVRVPYFEYWKLQFLNKRVLQLLKSGDIFRARRERGLVKPHIFMHSGGKTCWTMFDKDFENFQKLSEVRSDNYCFFVSDMEMISAGTQLIVIGREVEGNVVWRYELERHMWFKGPAMTTPRVMYGSASRGTDAFFAGGIKINEKRIHEVMNTSEKYNADTKMWTVIHGMHKRKKFSSGCFLRGKFYVLGGRDENDEYLTCGERYDEVKNSWELIPNMLKDMTFTSSQSPPLIAVVDDHLYSLETSLNELRVYDINANAWKKLGVVHVRANAALGWGVAFKSLGYRLLVIGPSSSQSWHRTIAVYTCHPSPDVKEQIWEDLKYYCDGVQLHQFIMNCCVMFA